MLRAFDFGAPPHGGIAMGIDRVAMLLRDTDNLREIVAFPKTQEGVDLAQRAPSAVTAEQLDELGLLLDEEPEPVSYAGLRQPDSSTRPVVSCRSGRAKVELA